MSAWWGKIFHSAMSLCNNLLHPAGYLHVSGHCAGDTGGGGQPLGQVRYPPLPALQGPGLHRVRVVRDRPRHSLRRGEW